MRDDVKDEELARDIGYALARSPFKAKGQTIEALRLVAAGVVRQLRLSGWLFTLKPPVEPHGPTLPPAMIQGGPAVGRPAPAPRDDD